MTLLALAARHGRLVLVAGLVAGFALPGLARILSAHIPEMVIGIMFLGTLRLSPGELRGLARGWQRAVGATLGLQLALPLIVLGISLAAGWAGSLPAMALVLLASAPAIVGSPNIAAIMGMRAGFAMQLLVIGTLMLPLTVIPVFWLMPALGSIEIILWAALKLLLTILVAGGGALVVRMFVLRDPSPDTLVRLDGASVIGLAIFVIGLMPALSETIRTDFRLFAYWLVVASVANFGTQIVWYLLARRLLGRDESGSLALVAGNRNVSLFFAALPQDITAPLLVFLGCYQLPMFLTPIIMKRLYDRRHD